MATANRRPLIERISKRKSRALTAMMQMRDMAKKYPEFKVRRLGNGATWEGYFRPTDACATYLVQIEALSGQRPRVLVLDPPLRISRQQYRDTHCFFDGSLCLHLHEEWTPDLFVADTIIPWVPDWLINYEYWLATGVWCGGGRHPE
jgi:hypothetical protein